MQITKTLFDKIGPSGLRPNGPLRASRTVVIMNLSLPNVRLPALGRSGELHALEDEGAQMRRLRSLLSLFALYAAALLFVSLLSDGADIGCILAGVAGHVFYASGKGAIAWRDASLLDS